MRHSTMPPLFVGIDYHKNQLQVCLLDRQGRVLANRSVANDWCWHVELAHAGYVAKLKGSPDKTDWGDARLLGDLTRVGYLPKVWLAPRWVRQLRGLVRYRQQQVNASRNEKLRIGALLRELRIQQPLFRRWTKGWLAWLESEAVQQMPQASQWILRRHLRKLRWLAQEIKQIRKQLQAYTRDDELTQRLQCESGIGEVTSWVLRAEVGQFDRFNSGQSLSRFCGLTPRNASSGSRQADGGLIKAGNGLLRATLIEMAHRLARHDQRWRAFKMRLKARGKAGSVIAAAIANRYMRGLYHRMQMPVLDLDGPAL